MPKAILLAENRMTRKEIVLNHTRHVEGDRFAHLFREPLNPADCCIPESRIRCRARLSPLRCDGTHNRHRYKEALVFFSRYHRVAHEPKLVLLDEPTAGLDGTTIVLLTHDMAKADKLRDRRTRIGVASARSSIRERAPGRFGRGDPGLPEEERR